MNADQIARSYPWTQYPRSVPCSQEEALKRGTVYAVDWIVNDNSPGLYGWRSETRVFNDKQTALEVAGKPMGRAREVCVRELVPSSRFSPVIYSRKNANQVRAKGK